MERWQVEHFASMFGRGIAPANPDVQVPEDTAVLEITIALAVDVSALITESYLPHQLIKMMREAAEKRFFAARQITSKLLSCQTEAEWLEYVEKHLKPNGLDATQEETGEGVIVHPNSTSKS